jgi:hypothetical protein
MVKGIAVNKGLHNQKALITPSMLVQLRDDLKHTSLLGLWRASPDHVLRVLPKRVTPQRMRRHGQRQSASRLVM